jgi:hypothetical protein
VKDGKKIIFWRTHGMHFSRFDFRLLWAIHVSIYFVVSALCLKDNGNCSTFCFPTPSGRRCGCQDNVNLRSDQTTCQGGLLSSF